MNDKEYMRLALQLAKKGCGWTSPNPMVGAVVVKEGRIIGQGWHQKYGQAHAERNALASCTEDPQGATLYVTLEPCCHYGKQPPCVDAILGAGIHRVVVGSADPNPLVAGKGIAILRAHGIDVTENVLQEECDALNKVFFHYITTKRPFVSMKYADAISNCSDSPALDVRSFITYSAIGLRQIFPRQINKILVMPGRSPFGLQKHSRRG